MNFLKLFVLYLVTMSATLAAPGAHGPDGEHLDAPGSSHVHSDAGPRVDTFTESFELVGHLQDDELSILIDRYETNEPVLNGKLEVEFNGLKAAARFHADHGDYAVDDEAFLKALAKPGKHSLIFTLVAGDESDLLEGMLEVKADDHAHSHGDVDGHENSLWIWAAAGVLLSTALVALAIRQLRRPSSTGR